MRANPTYHLPPNFTTAPAESAFQLGTIIKDFDKAERMVPFRQRVEDDINRLNGQDTGLIRATRKAVIDGKWGVWPKYLGKDIVVGGEVSITNERGHDDMFEVQSTRTEYFYPSDEYILKCLKLSEVADYRFGSLYKKPVFLVTGLKIGKGVTVTMGKKRHFIGAIKVGVHSTSHNLQTGPRVEGQVESKSDHLIEQPNEIVIGIQCWRIYNKRGLGLIPSATVRTEVYTQDAVFYGNKELETGERLADLEVPNPEYYGMPGFKVCVEGKEVWMEPEN